LCCPPMLVDNTITLSKKDKRTNNGVINIGGQHNNLNQKRPTDKQWGNQHWGTTQLPKVNVDYPIVCPFVFLT
jgi:hypothetical protein